MTLGALVAEATSGVPLASALGITAGNTLEALLGAVLLVWIAALRPALDRVRDVLAPAAAGAVSCALGATVGFTSLWLAGVVPLGALWSVWSTWWLGDIGGVLIVAPLLLALAAWRPAPAAAAGHRRSRRPASNADRHLRSRSCSPAAPPRRRPRAWPAASMAGRVLERLAQPSRVAAAPPPSASIGIAGARADDALCPRELLRQADAAMYHAKAEGGGRYALFAPAMSTPRTFTPRVQAV